jgi:hypothetical protein
MPNTYPQNPGRIQLSRFRPPRNLRGSLAFSQAKVSRKARTVLKLQDRMANQLFRLAAASGALSKKAGNRNNQALSRRAQTVSASASRMARQMWLDYDAIAAAALRVGVGSQPPIRSAAVRIVRSSRAGQSGGRPKGPVNIVNPANLANILSRLKTLQRDFNAFRAQRVS